jgi:hypothetical protein
MSDDMRSSITEFSITEPFVTDFTFHDASRVGNVTIRTGIWRLFDGSLMIMVMAVIMIVVVVSVDDAAGVEYFSF